MLRGPLALLLVVSVLWAGCAGSDLKAQVAPGPEAIVTEDTGSIRGFVTDDSLLPLESVQVGLKETGDATLTNPQGEFALNGIAPGSYQIAAVRLGYESVQKRIDVKVGLVSQINLVLRAVPTGTPYYETFDFKGFFDCTWRVAGYSGPCAYPGPEIPFPDTKRAFNYNVGPHWRTLHSELHWSQASIGTGSTLTAILSYANRTTGHFWSLVEGKSPVVQRCDRTADEFLGCSGSHQNGAANEPKEIPEEGTYTRHFISTGGTQVGGQNVGSFGMALQQSFELHVVVFYWEPAAADYQISLG